MYSVPMKTPNGPKIISESDLEDDLTDIDMPLAKPLESDKSISGDTNRTDLSAGLNGTELSIDRVNNLVQKETVMARVGLSRIKAYTVILRLLDAHKWEDVCDNQGNIKRENVPDLDKQARGAEMALKMFGDMIERKEIAHDIGDKTLERFRAMSVSELKARAADILLGKNKKVVDAEFKPV